MKTKAISMLAIEASSTELVFKIVWASGILKEISKSLEHDSQN